jgi:tRNA-2-methylthio-N6-dimethylallyladenosine synthase
MTGVEATKRKFLVRTFGCQMNEHDSERIASLLAAEGMERTTDVGDADIVVLNTCCIRQNADDKLYGTLGHLKSLQAERPGMQIAVGGCLAQKDRDHLLERAPHVNAVFGTHNIGRVASLLDDARSSGRSVIEILDSAAAGDEAEFPTAMAVRSDLPYAAWVTIQMGCDNSCAFCIVPAVRGPEVSRPFGDLVREVGALAASGTVEITLLGQNVNSYGRDLTTRLRSDAALTPGPVLAHEAGQSWVDEGARRPRPLFADLLRAVGAVPGIRRVRFISPHPKDLRPDTIGAMAETDAVCEQLHLPLQAGSNRVLAAMRRGYTAERYLERLAAARAGIEDLAVSTDIIVGFPGETEEDFERTLEVVAEAQYDSAYTFIFSPRPGTRAAEMEEEFVAPDEVANRFERLRVVVERSALARHCARIGRVEEALVEGPSKKDPSLLTGRTRQGKLVHFSPAGERGARFGGVGPGAFAQVRIDSAAPHHLLGTLVDVEPASARQPGRVAIRIPVHAG